MKKVDNKKLNRIGDVRLNVRKKIKCRRYENMPKM